MTDYIIAINCNRGHPDRPWRIGEFGLDVFEDGHPLKGADAEAYSQPPIWVFGEAIGKITMQGQRAARSWITPDGRALSHDDICGSMVENPDGSVTFTDGVGIPEGSYLRWQLHCGRCGYDLTARDEKLTVALDRLAAEGVSRISLEGLARVV